MTTGPAATRHRRSPAAYWRGLLSPWRTRRLLEAHLLAAFLLAAVASTALFLSCRQMEHSAEALTARDAPAVQGLAGTRLATLRAHEEADKLIGVDLTGETYRSQLSAADQGLSRIDGTDPDLGTIKGLLATYGNSLSLGTSLYDDEPLMRQQKLAEAKSLLTRETVGLAPRLAALQDRNLRHAEATSTLGGLQRVGWWAAEVALAALALTLLSALFVLRDRCGRACSPYLLAALLLTVLLALAPVKAALCTTAHLDAVMKDLTRITHVSLCADARRADAQQCVTATPAGGRALAEAQEYVTDESEGVRKTIREGLSETAWPNAVYRGALVACLLTIVLPVLGIGLRLDNDYWRRR